MGIIEYALLSTEDEITSNRTDILTVIYEKYNGLKKLVTKKSISPGVKKGKVRFDSWKVTPMCSIEFVANALQYMTKYDSFRTGLGSFIFDLCKV
jgi:hypothetical protein